MLLIFGTIVVYCGLYWMLKFISFIPKSLNKCEQDLWHITFLSLAHSFGVAVAVFVCFCIDPTRLVNLTAIEANLFVLNLPLYFIGFFIFDSICRSACLSVETYSVVAYQVLFSSLFMINMYFGYNNYILVALLCEVNNFFLHSLNLSLLYHKTNADANHYITELLYLITLVLFRVGNFAWILFHTVFVWGNTFAQFSTKSYFFIGILPYLFTVFATVALFLIHVYWLVLFVTYFIWDQNIMSNFFLLYPSHVLIPQRENKNISLNMKPVTSVMEQTII